MGEILKDASRDGDSFEGQHALEKELKRLRGVLRPPFCLTVYELRHCLADVWHFHHPVGGITLKGRFAIIKKPSWVSEESQLLYVDVEAGEWGPLLGPDSSRWQTPPYGFPAIFFVPLSSGAILWIRVEDSQQLRICYKEDPNRQARYDHYPAWRANPNRKLEDSDFTTIYFLSICMVHAFADGNCYMPLAQDLFSLYEAARKGTPMNLQALPNSLEALERRLFSTLRADCSPLRTSLRGAMFRYHGRAYGYTFCIHPGAVAALSMAASRYLVPIDVLLLGLVVCSLAVTDKADMVDFTLYTPMRDGPSEAMMIGLFADWRDLAVMVDIELSTVLGTMMQVLHAVQSRHWTPFNALRKPERTIMNIQPLDMERRSHFTHLGENLWHGGDVLGKQEERFDEMDAGRQPLTFNIEQQDETTWWILIDIGHKERPSEWTRKFNWMLQQAFNDLLFDPFAKLHRDIPDAEWEEWLTWDAQQRNE